MTEGRLESVDYETGQVVGCLNFCCSLEDVSPVEIKDIWVSSSHRRQGIGRLLFVRLATHPFFRNDVVYCYAFTRQSNQIAQEFYVSLGFNKIAEIPNYYALRHGRVEDATGVMFGRIMR